MSNKDMHSQGGQTMSRKGSRHNPRTKRGGILVLAVIILAFVVMPAGFLLTRCGTMMETRSQYQGDMEAASLLVADRLAKIVVNDPHFGFISLSNRPPIGR